MMKRLLLLLLPFLLPSLCSFAPDYNHSFDYNQAFKEEAKKRERKEYIEIIIKTFSYQETRGNHNLKGASGEIGEFQIMPSTWKLFCKIYAKKYIEPTRKAQKEMIYVVILDWSSKGLTVEQIAAKWNSGSHIGWQNKIGVNRFGVKYNVPRYVAEFKKTFNKLMKQKSNG